MPHRQSQIAGTLDSQTRSAALICGGSGRYLSGMTVIRATTLGTCRGVERALAILDRTLEEHPGTAVYTLGPLIHNPRVVEDYRRRGVVPVGSLSEVERGIVVIRAHGIGPEERRQCSREGVTCVDATCPDVLRVQGLVRDHAARGDAVVIVGDPSHVEVRGIRGYAPGSLVVSTEAEADAVGLRAPCIAVGQTTFPRDRFRRIAGILRRRIPGLEVHETCCPATERRQQSLVELSRKVEAIVIVGGKESANTRWLHQVAVATGRPAWHVEGAADLPREITAFRTVGISAGASTPESLIAEVEAALAAM
jgi:4-hydroxy-3-methylbut-2-en-1-yl diphosphate reductase